MSCHVRSWVTLFAIVVFVVLIMDGQSAHSGPPKPSSPPFRYTIQGFDWSQVPYPLPPKVDNIKVVESQPQGMNDRGDVVGWFEFEGTIDDANSEFNDDPMSELRAFLYTAEGELWDLTSLFIADTTAYWPGLGMGYVEDINNLGQVLGLTAPLTVHDDIDITRVRYTPGILTDDNLSPDFIGWEVFDARGINNWGDVVGTTNGGAGVYTDNAKEVVDLPLVNDDVKWSPRVLNDAGQVLGTLNGNQALRYTPGLVPVFKLLPTYTYPRDINNYGQIVGDYYVGTNRQAFWWYTDAKDGVERLHGLGTLGGKYSHAYSISDTYKNGVDGPAVVGMSTIKSGEERPFIYTRATGMVDLVKCIDGGLAPGLRLAIPERPSAINEEGQILGILSGEGVPQEAILLTPVE